MGKKGSWFSTIKRILISYYKEKPVNEPEKSCKEKKKGKGILRHVESKSFIPLFREPSSIEKILGEADQQKIFIRPPPPTLPGPPKPPPLVFPSASPPRVVSPKVASPKPSSSKVVRLRGEISQRLEPTEENRHLSATKIQAAFRGFTARKNFRALKGLARLQGVMRGQNVKRQITSAVKYSQLVVRVQTQIQSRRIQALENQALQQHPNNNDKDLESSLSKFTVTPSEARQSEDWEDSLLTKEEVEARWRRKVEATMKRERAVAYACSHQLWKSNPKSAETALKDIRSGGFPWWWKRLELQLPPSESQLSKNTAFTPSWQTLERKLSPRLTSSSYSQHNFAFDNFETPTPRSTRSAIPARTKQVHTPTSRTPPMLNSPGLSRYSKPRKNPASSTLRALLKDDDSLVSCPAFSGPNYMTPTASAKAKVRANSNPKERFPRTPSGESKKRFSFPLTPNIGSFKWNKGSNKDCSTPPQRMLEKHPSLHSVGDLSVDSAVSMPAAFGRKPFNRFV